jgi:hypothetical protein
VNEGLANSFRRQKHEKYALQAQIYIGLSEIGTFLYWILRHKYKRIYISFELILD